MKRDCSTAAYRYRNLFSLQSIMAIPAWLVGSVQTMIKDAEKGDRLVKMTEECMSLLEKHGFLYRMQLHCRHVAVHPSNRDGSGLNIVDTHELCDDLISTGFVLKRVSAVGVEVSDQKELQWNKNFVQSAGGKLGDIDTDVIKVLSLQGSHTNFVFRLFYQEALHDNPKVAANGRLSMELLKRHDPAFHDAIADGVQWQVLSRDVAVQLPELLNLIQRHGNLTLARGEHELQLVRRIHNIYMREYSSGQPVEYSKVCQAVLSTASKSKKALPHLYSFALKAAGGHSPWLLDETESFVRALASGTSILSADLWQALSMDVKGNSQHLRFRHAMVACQIVKYIVLFLFLDT